MLFNQDPGSDDSQCSAASANRIGLMYRYRAVVMLILVKVSDSLPRDDSKKTEKAQENADLKIHAIIAQFGPHRFN